MKNYDEMSDFEVNHQLLKHHKFNDNQCIGREVGKVYLLTFDDIDVNLEVGRVEMDYCNNWSDIGPMIEEHKVTVSPSAVDDANYSSDEWEASVGTGDYSCLIISHWSENPKRAAAICIIKLLESENGNPLANKR